IQQGSSLISDLQDQESTIKQCIEQLESVATARVTLINQLKEALGEQVLSIYFIFQMFHFDCICLISEPYVFLVYITGSKVGASAQSIASKNYSFIPSYMLLSPSPFATALLSLPLLC